MIKIIPDMKILQNLICRMEYMIKIRKASIRIPRNQSSRYPHNTF